jgi:hypothetical protein
VLLWILLVYNWLFFVPWLFLVWYGYRATARKPAAREFLSDAPPRIAQFHRRSKCGIPRLDADADSWVIGSQPPEIMARFAVPVMNAMDEL